VQRLLCVFFGANCINFNFKFNLFSVHLIREGNDPSDMELVNTEIRLQISYMK
jgi:hypothetical protein